MYVENTETTPAALDGADAGAVTVSVTTWPLLIVLALSAVVRLNWL
jgi:hypothetical protein